MATFRTPQQIIAAILQTFQITEEEFTGHRRFDHLCMARDIAAMMLTRHTDLSVPQIMELLHRDRSQYYNLMDRGGALLFTRDDLFMPKYNAILQALEVCGEAPDGINRISPVVAGKFLEHLSPMVA